MNISYAYLYLMRVWLTPGEALRLAFSRFPYFYAYSVLVTGWSFFERNVAW